MPPSVPPPERVSEVYVTPTELLVNQQRTLVDAMPHIVWTTDAAGIINYFNRRWTKYTGLDLAETLRVGGISLVHPDERAEVNRQFQEARAKGEPLKTTYRLRRGSDGAYRWHWARVVPMRGPEGRLDAWIGTAIDIDDQRRLSDEQAFLVEASRELGTSLNVSRTLNDVARLVVPHLADWCAIDLLKEDQTLERATVAHVDPAKVALAWEMWRSWPPHPEEHRGVYTVIRTKHAMHLEELSNALLAELIPDPERLALYRSLGLRSSLCVPLIARERPLGALTLVSAESGRRYRQGDLLFAEELARRIAFAVDNARIYTEATLARTAAEAMAAAVIEQSREVEEALLTMRAERDRALTRVRELEGSRGS